MATDNFPKIRKGRHAQLTIDQRDLRAWMEEKHPVILVIFDARLERAYWIYVQDYVRNQFAGGTTALKAFTTVRIPLTQLPLGIIHDEICRRKEYDI